MRFVWIRLAPLWLALLFPTWAPPTAFGEELVLEAPVTMEDVEWIIKSRHVNLSATAPFTPAEYELIPHPFTRRTVYFSKQEMREPLRALLDVPPRCDLRLDTSVTAEMRRKVRSGRHFEATFAPPLTCRLMGRVQEVGSILLPLDKAFLHPSSGQILIGERLVNPTTVYVFPLPMPRELLVDYVGANRQP